MINRNYQEPKFNRYKPLVVLILIAVLALGIYLVIKVLRDGDLKETVGLFNFVIVFLIYLLVRPSSKVRLYMDGLSIGNKIYSLTNIKSVTIFEDTVRIGGSFRSDPRTWKKSVKIHYMETENEGNHIILDIGKQKEELEEEIRMWCERKGIEYKRVPRGDYRF